MLKGSEEITNRNPVDLSYLYRLWRDLEFGQWSLAVRLHLSHGAAVWLSTVAFCLWAFGFCSFLAVHRPHICCGLLKHRAGFGHKRWGKGLTRVLSTGEGRVNPRGWVPVGLPFSRRLGAVPLLAVMLLGRQGAPQVAVAAGGAERALCRTWCVWLWVLRPSTVFTWLLFPHLPSVSLATAAAAATASVAPLAAESWAFLGLGWRSTWCRADRSPLTALATATTTDTTLVPTKQSRAWFLFRGRRAVRRFTANLWMRVTDRLFHLVVIAQHALNTTGQFVFLAGLKREAQSKGGRGGVEDSVKRKGKKRNESNEQRESREEKKGGIMGTSSTIGLIAFHQKHWKCRGNTSLPQKGRQKKKQPKNLKYVKRVIKMQLFTWRKKHYVNLILACHQLRI